MILLLLVNLLWADEPLTKDVDTPADTESEAWEVNAPHGDSHEVHLDLTEGTWMSVAVHDKQLVFDLLGDLWQMPLSGGDATRLTEGAAWDTQAAFSPDGTQIAYVSDEDGNEQLWLMNADGTNKRCFTQEKVARITHPVWDPSGEWIIARRRTVDTRSIGVTELWQYHLEGGKGFQLTTLDAHPHAGEHVVTEKYIYFSTRSSRFQYGHNPVGGLWRIVRLNRETSEIHSVVQGPGSATRPMLTADGTTLTFLSRQRNQTLLERLDLESGTRSVLADWLSPDEMEGFSLHATYPRMDWTSRGDLVLWANGGLWQLSLDGKRKAIPFHVEGDWTLKTVKRWAQEIPDTVRAKVIRWAHKSPQKDIAFSALGALWLQNTKGEVRRISPKSGFSPAWSPDGRRLAFTAHSDRHGGSLHIWYRNGRFETLPLRGQMVNPSWSSDGNTIVVLRGIGGTISADLGSESHYEMTLLKRKGNQWTSHVVTTTGNRGATARAPHLHIHEGRIYWMEDRATKPRNPSKTALVSVNFEGKDKRDHLLLPGADELVISPDHRMVAYKHHHQLYLTTLPQWGQGVEVAENGALPHRQLTEVVGDWLAWSPDSKQLSWMEGPVFHELSIEGIWEKDEEEKKKDVEDAETSFPVANSQQTDIRLELPRAKPSGTIALTHARLITMNGEEILEDASLVIKNDRILSINEPIPKGATVIDCTGKTIIPGLIDVHAHLHFGAADILPNQEWKYLVNLDFGVTTVQDPSASTDLVFTQKEMVETGFMKGPRILSTGGVLYGALSNEGAKTPTLDAARNHLRRLKAVGAESVKVYQQSQRERRQFYIQACDEEEILCVPEGGGDLFMNLGMILDGYHAIEHALPTAPLHADVRGLFTGSVTENSKGTFYSPTLLVAYGGIEGENYFYQNHNPINNERMRKHYPHRLLDLKTWRRNALAQDEDWRFQAVARDGAKMAREGNLRVTLGGHGQLQGIGVHWELWALASENAMTPHEALRAATIHGAEYIGYDHLLGSLTTGKMADLVILNANPLDDIHHSTDIHGVIKNGELFE